MLKASLRGQVRQTTLHKWKYLLPLFEAVMNAIQAVQEFSSDVPRITITVERDNTLFTDKSPAIDGFTVEDNGIGFDDDNFDSFNTAYSERKAAKGGKGLGRFIWLKAFEQVQIDSVFEAADVAHRMERRFVFDESYNPDQAAACPSTQAKRGTSVRLSGFREPYKGTCPRDIDQIAQRLVEHFVLMFLRGDAPRIELHDEGKRLRLNDIFAKDFQRDAKPYHFIVGDMPFTLHGFRLKTARAARHRLQYAADFRVVLSENLEDAIPNLEGRLPSSEGSSFVYLAIVQGKFLDQRVNNARSSFDMEPEESEEQQTIFDRDEIRLADIRNRCVDQINNDLADIIGDIDASKEARVLDYVEREAPQYKLLMRERADFLWKIKPSAQKSEIDAALHRELHAREVKLRQEGGRMIREAEKLDDYESYSRRVSEFMAKYNELGVSALAQYVGHRRIILSLLEKAVSRNPDDVKYPLERVVHNLIFPMRQTSADLVVEHQNLWIVDERLTHHSFIASDKPLSGLKDHFDGNSSLRGDIIVFDRKNIFSDGSSPINSVVTVEFKRPQRDDYTADDNPLTQSFDLVEQVRSGHFKGLSGRDIAVANGPIPAFCYVICDVTPSLKRVMRYLQGEVTPDGQGYYGYNRDFRCYFEVISYNKLLEDARRRNRIFFDKLNIFSFGDDVRN